MDDGRWKRPRGNILLHIDDNQCGAFALHPYDPIAVDGKIELFVFVKFRFSCLGRIGLSLIRRSVNSTFDDPFDSGEGIVLCLYLQTMDGCGRGL